MREALLVLLGALVGAAGSAAGSMLVARAQETRAARTRAYRDHVPPLLYRALNKGTENLDSSAIEELYREGALARRSDRALIDAALEGFQEQAARVLNAEGKDRYGNRVQSASDRVHWNEANEAYLASLRKLEVHLRNKLS